MTAAPVLRTIAGDFIVPNPAGIGSARPAWRWSGTITGPGVGGNLAPSVVIVGRAVTAEERKRFEKPSADESESGAEIGSEGVHRVPAVIAAAMAPATEHDTVAVGL